MSNQKVLKNTAAQFIGKVLTIFASFFVVKIVSGFGREFYGNYVTAYEFLAFFGIIADAGLFAIAVREMSKTPARTKFILGNIFSMRMILIITVSLIAGISAQFVNNFSPEVKLGIWLTSLSMALTIVAGTLSSVLQSRMKIHFFSGSLAFGKIILATLIFAISQVFLGQKSPEWMFYSFLIAGVISNIIFCGLVTFFTSRETPIIPQFDTTYWKDTFKVSLPYGVALILQTLYLRIDVVLISMMLGAQSVGIYGITTRIMESFLVLGVFFGQAFLPKISAEEHDEIKASKSLNWGCEKLVILGAPIIIGTIAFAPEIINLLSSNEFLSTATFLGSDKILQILVPTIAFAFLNQLFTFTLVAKNRQNFLMFVNASALTLNIVLNLIFLPKYGIIAAAFSTIFCEAIVFILLTIEILKHFRPQLCAKNLSIIFFANALIFTEIYLTPLNENFILAFAVSAISYFSIFWIFRKRFID